MDVASIRTVLVGEKFFYGWENEAGHEYALIRGREAGTGAGEHTRDRVRSLRATSLKRQMCERWKQSAYFKGGCGNFLFSFIVLKLKRTRKKKQFKRTEFNMWKISVRLERDNKNQEKTGHDLKNNNNRKKVTLMKQNCEIVGRRAHEANLAKTNDSQKVGSRV